MSARPQYEVEEELKQVLDVSYDWSMLSVVTWYLNVPAWGISPRPLLPGPSFPPFEFNNE